MPTGAYLQRCDVLRASVRDNRKQQSVGFPLQQHSRKQPMPVQLGGTSYWLVSNQCTIQCGKCALMIYPVLLRGPAL
jgi:hypothetical protein